MKNGEERIDVLAAYWDVGVYRAAATVCGTTHLSPLTRARYLDLHPARAPDKLMVTLSLRLVGPALQDLPDHGYADYPALPDSMRPCLQASLKEIGRRSLPRSLPQHWPWRSCYFTTTLESMPIKRTIGSMP